MGAAEIELTSSDLLEIEQVAALYPGGSAPATLLWSALVGRLTDCRSPSTDLAHVKNARYLARVVACEAKYSGFSKSIATTGHEA